MLNTIETIDHHHVTNLVSMLLRGPIGMTPAEWTQLELYCGWNIKVKGVKMRMVKVGENDGNPYIALVLNDTNMNTWVIDYRG